jgi:phosphotransferase system HPr (HPr) family protein
MPVSEEIVVRHKEGLHARPAAQFVKLAASFSANVQVENLTKGSQLVNAKSIISVLSVNVVQDDKIRITAEGKQEQEAVTAIVDLITCNFETDD